MSDVRRRPSDSSRGLWVLILVLLTPAIVLPLLVPLYDQIDPTLLGFPFFYWFQFALIVMSSCLTLVAYRLSKVAHERYRAARRAAREGSR